MAKEKAFANSRPSSMPAGEIKVDKWQLPEDYNFSLDNFTNEELPRLRDKLKDNLRYYREVASMDSVKKSSHVYKDCVDKINKINAIGLKIKERMTSGQTVV